MKSLYLIGGGGHCKSCIDVIESSHVYAIKGIFDIKENVSKKVLDYEIIGTDEDISKYVSQDNYFLITVGQIKTPEIRKKVYGLLKKLNANLATVISSKAYVSKHAIVGEGSIIMHEALINAGAKIGINCIINTKSLIEHDSIIEDHCHISTAAVVNGGCIVEEGTFIGSNTVLRECVKVVKNSVLSAGSFYNGK